MLPTRELAIQARPLVLLLLPIPSASTSLSRNTRICLYRPATSDAACFESCCHRNICLCLLQVFDIFAELSAGTGLRVGLAAAQASLAAEQAAFLEQPVQVRSHSKHGKTAQISRLSMLEDVFWVPGYWHRKGHVWTRLASCVGNLSRCWWPPRAG